VTATTTSRAWTILADVPDPEIPVLSVIDLGIVRAVEESTDGTAVTVTLTPTYSGCPATEVIAHDVRAALEASYETVEVKTQLAGMDHRLAERRSAREVEHLWHRTPGRSNDAAIARRRHSAGVPALRVRQRRGARGVRVDTVQGAVAVRVLSRAVRLHEAALTHEAALSADAGLQPVAGR